MSQELFEALSYSDRWLGIIHKKDVTEEEGKKISEE